MHFRRFSRDIFSSHVRLNLEDLYLVNNSIRHTHLSLCVKCTEASKTINVTCTNDDGYLPYRKGPVSVISGSNTDRGIPTVVLSLLVSPSPLVSSPQPR